MKIATRAASVCSLVVLTALLGFSVFEGVGAVRGTWRIVPVLSGSMRPLMPTGSAVITWKTPMRDLHVGSIVAYRIPVDDHHVEMHRVVSLKRVPGGVVVHTKGDANNGPDPWSAKLTGASYWRVGLDVPKIGWPIVELQKPLFRLAVTLFAAFGFLFSSRRRSGDGNGAGDVVDVRVAEAVVGALEEELAHERVELRGEIDFLARRLELFQDEDGHRRRMRDVGELLADLRGGPAPDQVEELVSPDVPPLVVATTIEEAPSLLDVLDERIAAVRAGTAGLAA